VTTAALALRWLAIVLGAAAFFVGWPLLPALVLAAWTAALARPIRARLEAFMKGRARAAATATVLVFILLALPVLLLSLGVLSGIEGLIETIATAPTAKSALETLTSANGPDAEPHWSLPRSLDEALSLLGRYGAQVFQLGSRIAGLVFKGAIALFVYFAGVYSLLLRGEEAWAWFQSHLLLSPGALDRLKSAFYETGRGLLFGVGLTLMTQGLIATIVYVLLDVPRAWVLGPLTGIAAIVPVVGTSLVWAPVAVGFFLRDDLFRALLLAGLGMGVISTVDNLVRPFYTRLGALQLPMLVIFVSILGGLTMLGPPGAILGPLVVRMCKEALALDREHREGA
jgi:predicted PurR-regulated permease PerM